MDKLLAELKSNPELKKEFVAFMHSGEINLDDTYKAFQENFIKHVTSSFKAFADKKGIALKDSAEFENLLKEEGKKISVVFSNAIHEMYKNLT